MKKGDLELDSDLDAYDIKFRKGKRGSVLYKGKQKWRKLPPGTDGEVLTTHGPGADPTWDPCAVGVRMATGTYVGDRAELGQDIVVGFTADFIQVSWASWQGPPGIIAHRIPQMETGIDSVQFCIVINDLGGPGVPGIIPTTELTQPVANQFHVDQNLNLRDNVYYWVAFKKQP